MRVLRLGFCRRFAEIMPESFGLRNVNLPLKWIANLLVVGRAPLGPFVLGPVKEQIANLWNAIFAIADIDRVIVKQVRWEVLSIW